jgi:alpha-galactosidase
MSLANSWRISGDIYDSFTRPDDLCSCEMASDPHCVAPGSHCSVLNIINKVAPYSDRAQPGGWNDLDMLEVGNGGMTDDEYKAHFSMWAAVKSPLLMGNDLRKLSPKSLTILNNPAIIAISQDPLGKSAQRVRRDVAGVKKDKYGIGEIQVWSGVLWGHDQVVILLNAGNEDTEISTSLEEIFVADGPEGSADQVHEEWEVYDLWASRMAEDVAHKILKAEELGKTEEAIKFAKEVNWYNSTAIPYKQGLQDGDERLMGKKVANIKPEGTLTQKVPKHGVGIYRLRNANKNRWRKTLFKDEL